MADDAEALLRLEELTTAYWVLQAVCCALLLVRSSGCFVWEPTNS
jgi:hypothetical protein